MIGILTLYKNNKNYGGLLQAYALQSIISGFGLDSEQISYELSPYPFMHRLEKSAEQRSLGQNLKKSVQAIYKRGLDFLLGRWSRSLCRGRNTNFAEFEAEIPHSRAIYNLDSIMGCRAYDVYITGSDQVWNGSINLEAYSLHFVKGTGRCISYAASYGGGKFTRWQKKTLQESLAQYKAISVREKSLAQELNKFISQDISVVLDPVMLVTPDAWEREMRSLSLTQPFVFCYLLGDSKWHREFAQNIAKINHCQLITIPYAVNGAFRFSDLHFGDIQDVSSGPREFLWLIRHAQCVITDSFHATAFSILFNTNFWALPRYKEVEKNRRVSDLLQEFDLQDRLVPWNESMVKSLDSIDFTRANSILYKRTQESLKFLKTALGINDENKPT